MRIWKVGYEIEGEFSQKLIRELRALGDITGDGSLEECGEHGGDLVCAEFRSIAQTISKLDEYNRKVFNLLQRENDNAGFHWNSTCGLHIHFSFIPRAAVEIRSLDFAYYFAGKLDTHYPQVVRKRANNNYCELNATLLRTRTQERETMILPQLASTHRYQFVNIEAAMRKHKTIEVRIFNADEPRIMKEYIDSAVNWVRVFCKEYARKPMHYAVKQEIDNSVQEKTYNV